MRKNRIALFAVMAFTLGMMVPSYASPSPGGAAGFFQCQVVVLFPNLFPKSPAKTNCDGAAWGAGTGLGKGGSAFTFGFEPTKGLIAVGPFINGKKPQGQGKFENFEAYNIKYSEICADGESVPLIGFANGYAFFNANDPLRGGVSVVAHFNYTRVVTKWTALLDSVTAYNNKWPQNGGPKPTVGGTGFAWGDWIPKPPIGGCFAPNPQQGMILSGNFVVQF